MCQSLFLLSYLAGCCCDTCNFANKTIWSWRSASSHSFMLAVRFTVPVNRTRRKRVSSRLVSQLVDGYVPSPGCTKLVNLQL